MTATELRAEADRLERLAMDATKGPWHATGNNDSADVNSAAGEIAGVWGCDEGRANADLIAANDPAATLRRVAEMRLLADAMAWIDRQERRDYGSPPPVPMGALLRRFAELEADNG